MARPADPEARDRILKVASRLFYEHGVRAVGMAQVIEAAGCGKNLLYRHFPSKAELAAAYLDLTRELREPAPGSADPAESLVAIVEDVAARVREEHWRGCAFRNYLTEFPAGDDAPARIARAYLTTTRARVGDLVARLGRPPLLADRIWLLIDGLYAGTGTDPRVAVDWVRELVAPPGNEPHPGNE